MWRKRFLKDDRWAAPFVQRTTVCISHVMDELTGAEPIRGGERESYTKACRNRSRDSWSAGHLSDGMYDEDGVVAVLDREG